MATRTGAKRRRKNPAGAVSVRMYNVGFGDCFLVTVPGPGRPLRILFDCGSISQAPGISMDTIVERLWRDATDEGSVRPRIDVVVATHRHRDHVSGFAKPGWNDVEVGEVWMPWTEDPGDPVARRIRDTQSRLAIGLNAALTARLTALAPAAPERARLEQWQELAANALSNERAMTMLHDGFATKAEPKFLPGKDINTFRIDTQVLPGVSAFVLGPSRDKDVIRDMDPPAGQSYLRMTASGGGDQGVPEPFGSEWQLDPETWTQVVAVRGGGAASEALTKLVGMRSAGPQVTPASLDEADRQLITEMGETDQAVAVALDKAVNGTSLIIVLKIGQLCLLFPGDAQWGSWQAALKNPDARELMRTATFYKVGHHGSHNATPVEFVEEVMTDKGLVSMVSTAKVEKWEDIPRVQLLQRMQQKGCAIARSDTADVPDRFTAGDLYIDARIELPA